MKPKKTTARKVVVDDDEHIAHVEVTSTAGEALAPTRGMLVPVSGSNVSNLMPIQHVTLDRIRENPLNAELFTPEDTAYFGRLRDDVRMRGIQVPLIAKRDGTLIAGHNRLRVARELGLKTIPVQYVKSELTSDAEREAIIKDNLLRRQLSVDERIALYKQLYPNFDERLHTNGRPNSDALTAAKIAADTGENVETVRKQLQKYKNGAQDRDSAKERLSKREIRQQLQAISTELDVALVTMKNGSIAAAIAQVEQIQRQVQTLSVLP